MNPALIKLFYLLAAVMFIVGLKRLSSPRTARSGNWVGAIGMLIAIVATALFTGILTWQMVIIGLIVGSLIGGFLAKTVKMTAMPEMVALLNGFGGGASALVAAAEFLSPTSEVGIGAPFHINLTVGLSVFVGALTFSGSLVAFLKLREWITGRAVTYPLQKTINALLVLATLTVVVGLVLRPEMGWLFAILAGLSLILGILSVIPIGGADMPVVISLLNSYSGIAAAMTGFVINNEGLVVSGALVGASGIILTQIMCKAMNRSLTNVLFGAFGATVQQIGPAGGAAAAGSKTYREITHEDCAMMLAYSKLVVVAPGYGLAVAQAQHEVRELAELLEKRGVEVKYAIHPVAGRMPGHMNVLLAEANVPYDQLLDMETINPEFDHTDVVLVIGANDVVNPAARNDTSSPIYGMPILDVDHAQNVIVLKRSMRPGFAGIDNALFYEPRTRMLFGDAKDSMKKLVAETKHVE
jgi:NAD(P) transhydrogenase subunit beta